MPSRDSRTDASTRKEWRKLKFYYDFDKNSSCWRIIGSKSGLNEFCNLLRQYIANPKNNLKSEHEHYGPYMYLEIMTWDEPKITSHAIAGTLEQLKSLAEICQFKIQTSNIGDVIIIDKEFGHNNPAKLQLEIQKDNFDPVDADPQLK